MKRVLLALLVVSATILFASDGVSLTKRCVGCHGVKFDKAPLGRSSHIVQGDSFKKIVDMIKYYQHPKEADEMVMKPQVVNLTDKQIDTIAKYIVGLK